MVKTNGECRAPSAGFFWLDPSLRRCGTARARRSVVAGDSYDKRSLSVAAKHESRGNDGVGGAGSFLSYWLGIGALVLGVVLWLGVV